MKLENCKNIALFDHDPLDYLDPFRLSTYSNAEFISSDDELYNLDKLTFIRFISLGTVKYILMSWGSDKLYAARYEDKSKFEFDAMRLCNTIGIEFNKGDARVIERID